MDGYVYEAACSVISTPPAMPSVDHAHHAAMPLGGSPHLTGCRSSLERPLTFKLQFELSSLSGLCPDEAERRILFLSRRPGSHGL